MAASTSGIARTALTTVAVVVARALARRRMGERSRPIFARWYGVLSRRAERGELGERRRRLLAQANGRVLDVGAGPGDALRHLTDQVREVVALEPDPAMVRQLRRRLGEVPVPARLVRGGAERLPFPDHSFDSAVVLLVLCTVNDPVASLAEIHRVLRPGGRLLLMEHVRSADEVLAGWQDRCQGLWARFNGGCRPNRATLDAIQEAGFRLGKLETYGFPALPHVEGVALRP